MNWGHKLAIAFICFVIFIIGMVVVSMSTDFYLVEENYYEEELAFQDKIDSQINGQNWTKNVSIKEFDEYIEIIFEDADLVSTGNISFFRPSNAQLDFAMPLVETLKLPKKDLLRGKWVINLEWVYQGQNYFKEQTLIIGS